MGDGSSPLANGFVQSLLPLIGWTGGAGFQHVEQATEDLGRIHSLPRLAGATEPVDGHRACERHRIERTGEGHQGRGEGGWHAPKNGGANRGPWRRIHIGVDEQTLEIPAIEITGGCPRGRPRPDGHAYPEADLCRAYKRGRGGTPHLRCVAVHARGAGLKRSFRRCPALRKGLIGAVHVHLRATSWRLFVVPLDRAVRDRLGLRANSLGGVLRGRVVPGHTQTGETAPWTCSVPSTPPGLLASITRS